MFKNQRKGYSTLIHSNHHYFDLNYLVNFSFIIIYRPLEDIKILNTEL